MKNNKNNVNFSDTIKLHFVKIRFLIRIITKMNFSSFIWDVIIGGIIALGRGGKFVGWWYLAELVY